MGLSLGLVINILAMGASIVVQRVKPSMRITSASHTRVPAGVPVVGCFLFVRSSSLLIHLRNQHSGLSHPCETRMEFLASALGWPSPYHWGHLFGHLVSKQGMKVSFSVTLPFERMNGGG